MPGATQGKQLAAFAQHDAYADLSQQALAQFKLHLLDTMGCAIDALDGGPPRAVRRVAENLGGERGPCTLIGGGATAPDRATLVNGALVRYLDFMDNFLAPFADLSPPRHFCRGAFGG